MRYPASEKLEASREAPSLKITSIDPRRGHRGSWMSSSQAADGEGSLDPQADAQEDRTRYSIPLLVPSGCMRRRRRRQVDFGIGSNPLIYQPCERCGLSTRLTAIKELWQTDFPI